MQQLLERGALLLALFSVLLAIVAATMWINARSQSESHAFSDAQYVSAETAETEESP